MPDARSASPAPAAGGEAPAPPAGGSGSAVLYRERLLPSPPVWVVGAVAGGAFGLILVPISPTAALITSIAMMVVMCALLASTSPVLEVTGERVQFGRAGIEPELLGAPEVLDATRMRAAMGVDIEPLAYHCTRGWIRTGVRVPVLDPEDPAPAWVASSRRPEALARAIAAAQPGTSRPA